MCENLDVDLEAIACVHSLQYSTVQYSNKIHVFFLSAATPSIHVFFMTMCCYVALAVEFTNETLHINKNVDMPPDLQQDGLGINHKTLMIIFVPVCFGQS